MNYRKTTLPEGENKTIGGHQDLANNRYFYCNWNSNNNHGIYYFNGNDGKIYTVWIHPLLNFQKDKKYRIKGMGVYTIVIDGKLQTLLYFTDGYNPVRVINIDTIGTLFCDKQYYEDRFINLAKSPPLIQPAHTLRQSALPASENRLNKKCLQAIYRYVYREYQPSVWSPVSKLVSNAYAELATKDETVINYAADVIDYATGGPGRKYRKLIDHIEIAVRESYGEPFRIVKRLYLKGQNQSEIVFRNDNTYPIAQGYGAVSDGVPLLAEGLACVDNRVALGGNTDGFNFEPLTVDVVSTTSNYQVDIAQTGSRMALKNDSIYNLGIVYSDGDGRSTTVRNDENGGLTIKTAAGFNPTMANQHARTFTITSPAPSWAKSFQIFRTQNRKAAFFLQGITNSVSFLKSYDETGIQEIVLRQIGYVGVWNGSEFKTEVSTSDGSKYITDEETHNTEGAGQKMYTVSTPIYEGGLNSEGKKLVQAWNDVDIIGDDDETLHYDKAIGYDVNGDAIMFGGVGTNGLPINIFVGSQNNGNLKDVKYLGVNISNWYNTTRSTSNTLQPNNRLFYNFQKGDRVTFISTRNNTPISGAVDIPIIDFKADHLIIPVTPQLLAVADQLGVGVLIEVYNPADSRETEPYFEFGHSYKIIDGKHEKTTFTIWEGDTHLVKKKMYANNYATPDNFYVYSMNPDSENTYGFWERGQGRVNYIPENADRQATNATQVKISDPIIQDSLLNGTSNFQKVDSSFTYPAEYGVLTKLMVGQETQVQSVGTILYALFSTQNVSIYINRTTMQDLGGNSNVMKSDRLLGSYYTLLGSYGSTHPGSAVGVDSRIYSWDASKGVEVRYSRDGLTPISSIKNAKMRRYFRNLVNRLRGKEYDVVAGYDSFNNELFLTFIDETGEHSETLIWNEDANRWTFTSTFIPEHYGAVDNQMLIFQKGQLYKAEALPEESLVFFGKKHDAEAETVTNILPSAEKIFESTSLESTDAWACSFETPYKGSPRIIQASSLRFDQLQYAEGKFEATIPGDANSPNLPASERLVRGRNLAGYALRTRLKLDPAIKQPSVLFAVNVNFDITKPVTTT